MTRDLASPVPSSERIEAIDIIRGFALLGVLLMNDQFWFRGPGETYNLVLHPFPDRIDVVADWILTIFFESKSVSLFSFLFGVGLAIQLERADAKGVGFGGYALRRLGALLGIGVLHILLVWMGDILHIYAVLGFVLLLFLRRRPGTALVWGLILLVLPWLGLSIYILVSRVLVDTPNPPMLPLALGAWIEQSLRAYQHGSWLDTVGFRLRDYVHHSQPRMFLSFLPYALGLFLLGLWTWRRGILRSPEQHERFLRRFFAIAFPIGLGLAAVVPLLREIHYPHGFPLGAWLRVTSNALGTPLLALSYGAGLLLLTRRAPWRQLLAPLAPVGRMALTNYLMQSLVMTWVYNGYGLGLYGKIGPAAAAFLCVALFALQIVVSRWWLSRYRFGPAEWLWRSLTYAKMQPMRR